MLKAKCKLKNAQCKMKNEEGRHAEAPLSHAKSRRVPPRFRVGEGLGVRVVRAASCIVFLLAAFALSAVAQEKPAAPAAEAKPKLETPRDWFKLYGIDESHFAKFNAGEPVGDDETEPLLKVIYQMRRFEPLELEGWAHRNLDPAKLAADMPAFQGEIYAFTGKLRNVTVLKPVDEVAALFELPEYYRCEIELTGGGKAVVYAAAAPKAWLKSVPAGADARIAALGAFIKTTGPNEEPAPAFAAARIAWYPDTPLGDLEFDYGLFDEIRDRTPPEPEPLYQLMAAARRSKPGALERTAQEALQQLAAEREGKSARPASKQQLIKDPLWQDEEGAWRYSVRPLFRDAPAQRGRLVTLSGTARQVQKIFIDDPEVRRRFGIDHYYHVSVYCDDAVDDKGRHPVVFCVLELPKDMPVGSTERYGEAVSITGFMMKVWSYQLHIPAGFDPKIKPSDKLYQPAPLLVGRELTWYPTPAPPPRSTLAAIIAMSFLVVAVALGWIGMARLYRTKGTAAERPLPEKIDIPQ